MSWGFLSVAEREVPGDDAWLGAAERALAARLATPRRRADWRLGRWAAKGALARWLALETARAFERLEVLPDAAGRPRASWRSRPLPLDLSISHRCGRALALVGASGSAVGCDLERVEPRSAAFVADYFTAAERAAVAAAPVARRALLANLLWSAKESVLKLAGVGLSADTRAVEIELGAGRAVAGWRPFRATWSAGAAAGAGWWRLDDGFVSTFARHPGAPPPRALAATPRAGEAARSLQPA